MRVTMFLRMSRVGGSLSSPFPFWRAIIAVRAQVRIVYFETAQTWSDAEVLTRLGAAELYLAPLVGVEGIKFTSEYSRYEYFT